MQPKLSELKNNEFKDTFNLALSYDIVFVREGDKITEITLDNTRRLLKIQLN